MLQRPCSLCPGFSVGIFIKKNEVVCNVLLHFNQSRSHVLCSYSAVKMGLLLLYKVAFIYFLLIKLRMNLFKD